VLTPRRLVRADLNRIDKGPFRRRLPPDVSESEGRAFANLGIEHAPTSGMAGGDEPMQDQDRDQAVDQGRDSRGVFAGKQRPGGPWQR
jgi:hypothetical protein